MNFMDELITAAKEWETQYGAVPQLCFLGEVEFAQYQRQRPKNPGHKDFKMRNDKAPERVRIDVRTTTLEIIPVKKPSFMRFGI